MLGVYLYTLIIGHKSCNMLSTLNILTLQKEFQNSVTNNVFWTKSKNTTTTKQKIKHKNPCWSRELSPGHLALKADALPLHHPNSTQRLIPLFSTVTTATTSKSGSSKGFNVWFSVLLLLCFYFLSINTLFLSQKFGNPFATLIYFVFLTFCKMCDWL